MPEPVARVKDVADAVTALLASTWNPSGDDGVETSWLARMFFAEDDQTTLLRGRRLFVMPAEHRLKSLTRGMWLNGYAVMVLMAERYADPGAPPDAWVDERVRWWEQTVLYPLANPELQLTGPAGVVPCAMPDPASPPELVAFVDRQRLTRNKALIVAATFSFMDASDFTGAG